MRKTQLAIISVLVFGAGAGFWFTGRGSPVAEAVRELPAPVEASTVTRRDVPVYLTALGNVQAYNSVLVRAQVDGQITEVAFKEGQEIATGDILAKIDSRTYQANLDQALARKAQDEAQLDNARRDLRRRAALVEKELVARQLFDTTQAQVTQFEAAVKGDDAAIEFAAVNLGYATVRSPIDGRAGIRRIDKGNVVHANDSAGIVTITQTRPISILFTLPEDNLQGIVKAMAAGPLTVAALSRDGQMQFDVGELTLIDNEVDRSTGTIRLKATVPNQSGLLWPGQFVTARLHLSTLPNVLSVPASALQNGPEGRFVFVIKTDGAVEARRLELGPIDAETAVVERGLKEGELVVTKGQYRLSQGSKVTVARAGAVAVRRDDNE
ncbi:efflux RND transporter periplasmic adaptor subunit [Methylocapsa acidiphila]|uniref:efflux RND transporter periplasmic adaptor subunit n=1 Tax=Methylocapsa acidiphila TaxID=133552 RepID=UPI00040E5B4B|nr:efflux RND transporter periplasmic adaptor subunit [Methylocapsa acidiphila]